jgi:hypothetical protein
MNAMEPYNRTADQASLMRGVTTNVAAARGRERRNEVHDPAEMKSERAMKSGTHHTFASRQPGRLVGRIGKETLRPGATWSINTSTATVARPPVPIGRDADDAVQLTWLRCLEHIDQLSQANRLAAWLTTICRRECLRPHQRDSEVPLSESPDDTFDRAGPRRVIHAKGYAP